LVFAVKYTAGKQMRTLNVHDADLEHIIRIQKDKQFSSRSDAVSYILRFYAGNTSLPLARKVAPIIDADKPRTAEELRTLASTRKTDFIQLGGKKA
jgi:hypothetical protein